MKLTTVNYIVIHHSQSAGGAVDFLRWYHRKRGWTDVGYHYIIPNGLPNGEWKAGEDGAIQRGRADDVVGAQARGHNRESLGICLIGDFTKDKPTARQMKAVKRLCAKLCKKYDLTPDAIVEHRKLPRCNTDCPGKHMSRRMPFIRMYVKWQLRK